MVIRVLVVDDSAFMRKVISDLLASDPEIEVVGTARDGQDALERAAELKPDVITLDVEMPRMDGLTFLQRMMATNPRPVVMVSSLTKEGADTTLRALSLGAVDFVAKPSGSISLDMNRIREDLVGKIRMAARARPRQRAWSEQFKIEVPRVAPVPGQPPRHLVCIGCSTGGPGALHEIIPQLPGNLEAGVVIVQHMPPGFTRSLAERLNQVSSLTVKEAAEGDRLASGLVLVAPGGYHLAIEGDGRIRLTTDPPRHGVRPAVDVTLQSAAEAFGQRVLAVILTGMGFDGARGAAAVRQAGGRVIAEHESSCVIYGMPRAVIEMGVADRILPLGLVGKAIAELLGSMP